MIDHSRYWQCDGTLSRGRSGVAELAKRTNHVGGVGRGWGDWLQYRLRREQKHIRNYNRADMAIPYEMRHLQMTVSMSHRVNSC